MKQLMGSRERNQAVSDDQESGLWGAPPELNPFQREIADAVIGEYDRGIRRTYLLHGVTGSGKTEVIWSSLPMCCRRESGDCADSGDFPYLADRDAVLQPFWQPGVGHEFPDLPGNGTTSMNGPGQAILTSSLVRVPPFLPPLKTWAYHH